MKLHPQIIAKEGKNEFVVLPYEEYQALTELMYDYEDLRDLREAKDKSRGEKSIPLDQVISDFGSSEST
ncbi:MAG: type II toxin-antitoxin system prevent-host-death family antitoxin [Nitrosomonas sp.]|jgi:PHD/YefM family antitoxin component YafN of YafNO toxin-antitoxin module|nr:type II toxin-antitoxin system prevent-host-death family antitoxin [Nitrosomonas sp.]MBK7365800.1 type II toxin-antitoxin system prevent-host-death family antitoxin [Nitrosomonas sp.]